ncbi:MAG: serine hydrolase, partial [bacterium]|nr:serine hydrolase [bacterium]
PVCSITSPSNRATFSKGDTIEISVDASDENSTIHYVQFIIDGEIKFWDTESPFVYEWDTSDESCNSYVIRVIAKNDDGETASNLIRIDLEYSYSIPQEIGDGWEISSVAEQGLDIDLINAAYGRASQIPHIYSLLIIKNGYIVAEEYFNDQNVNSANPIASSTKSFTSALVGIALKEGFLTSLDQKMMDFFPEYDTPTLDPGKRDITLRHMLKNRTGYPYDSARWFFDRLLVSPLWFDYIIGSLPLETTPGTNWTYSNGCSYVLGGIITKATGMSAHEFANQYLCKPLGIEIPRWPTIPDGYTIGGGDLEITPRDMAKFGMLYLNDGYMDGKQLFPDNWVNDSLTDYSGIVENFSTFHNQRYGYLWWLTDVGGVDLWHTSGYGGNYIFTYPEKNVIFVTTADNLAIQFSAEEYSLIYAMCGLVTDYVVPAVR